MNQTGRTYVFTDDIVNYRIVVECSNIIVDGNGFTLQQDGVHDGVTLLGCSNVTVKNLGIWRATGGIALVNASRNNITSNSIFGTSDYYYAISLDRNSPSNSISKNMIVGSRGIIVESNSNTITRNKLIRAGSIEINGRRGLPTLGSYNNIYANEIVDCWTAFEVSGGYHNSFHANNVKGCHAGISLVNIQKEWEHRIFGPRVANNKIYHNNFIGNSQQVRTDYNVDTEILYNDNFFDNGTEGNYWSGYVGNDTNSDGIGDVPYIIDANRSDNHPLIAPFDIENNIKVIPSPAPLQSPIEQQPASSQYASVFAASAVVAVVVVGAGLLLYNRKRRKGAASV
jgi:nitrous oxidase accessory protein NosD